MLVSLAACGGGDATEEPQLVEVTRGDIVLSVSADGNLALLKQRQLMFGTSGTISEISVEEGDRVSSGQVLASLDTSSLEITVSTVEIAVKAAEIDLELATDSFRQITYPYTYYTFAFSVPESVASIGDAQREIAEAKAAVVVGLDSEGYWQIKSKLEEAEDDLLEAESKLARGIGEDVFGSGIIPITSYWVLRNAQLQMEKAQLALDKANNDLVSALDQLDKAQIVAPFDGIVARVSVKEGEMLSSINYNSRVIIDVIEPSRMELSTEVDEIDIADVKMGQKAVISLDALPDLQLEGKVTTISPLAIEEAGLILYEVKIDFEVPESSGLKSGMTANADIIVAERAGVLLIPDRAIKENSAGDTVVNVLVNGETEERAVVIGISDGIKTEVKEGLREGETVVVEARRTTTSTGLF